MGNKLLDAANNLQAHYGVQWINDSTLINGSDNAKLSKKELEEVANRLQKIYSCYKMLTRTQNIKTAKNLYDELDNLTKLMKPINWHQPFTTKRSGIGKCKAEIDVLMKQIYAKIPESQKSHSKMALPKLKWYRK